MEHIKDVVHARTTAEDLTYACESHACEQVSGLIFILVMGANHVLHLQI
jgi:hypothetical protein